MMNSLILPNDSHLGPGGRFRMSPALAAAQQADLQAAEGGNVGTIGPGGAWGVVPGGKIYLYFTSHT